MLIVEGSFRFRRSTDETHPRNRLGWFVCSTSLLGWPAIRIAATDGPDAMPRCRSEPTQPWPGETLVNGKACQQINAKTQPDRAAPTAPITELVKSSVNSVVLIVWTHGNNDSETFGSGFVVSPDGKIVTNHHVIAGARSATVIMNNGAYFKVDGVLGDDPEHDLAVIKVPGKNLPSLSLADSDNLSVGDYVLAIGSPEEWENSVSDGIISGIRQDKGKTWIQTTAPASHGNSGGPLLLMDGKVAGVLTWKDFDGENLNFALPSNLIAPLLTNDTVHPLEAVPHDDVSSSVIRQQTPWKLIFGSTGAVHRR